MTNRFIALTKEERVTLAYALLVGVTCGTNDVATMYKLGQTKNADDISKLVQRCERLYKEVTAFSE